MLCSMDVFEFSEELETKWLEKDPRDSWAMLNKAPKGEHFVVELDVGGRKVGAFANISSTRNFISRAKVGAFANISSTRNFISRAYVDMLRLGDQVQRLSKFVASTLANKHSIMIVRDYVKDVVCTFSYGGGELRHKISFLVSDELPFDMLLGIYDLEYAKPQFDWDRKVMIHKLPNGRSVRLQKFKVSRLVENYGCMCASFFYNYYKHNRKEDDWDEKLPLIASLYNNVVHNTIGKTPNQLHLGWKPRSALDFLLPENQPTAVPGSIEFVVKYEQMLQQAVEHIKKAQDVMVASENRHRRLYAFQVGEQVWVKLYELGHELGISCKLMPQYFGPWEILDIVGDQPDGPSYVIRILGHLSTLSVFHAFKLAPFAETKEFPSRRSMLPPTMDRRVDIHDIVEHKLMHVPNPPGRGRPPKPQMQYRVWSRHRTEPKEDRWFTRE
ncbi:hypothetical protein CBR_g429 [Chara braunii]|uniref:Integrase catalytic domain-containing protein n=1 Tax=Chara braunii TaxID=69332 RepID=A0A388JQP8_CHABU|nr:hypothetical protein CBR_g429 [Chara braunii]|eukprot:GBG60098.1 hypothetical protein CBR_g429 [Chara braunii]